MKLKCPLTAVDWAEFVSLWRSMQAMRFLDERLDRVIRAPSRDLFSPLGLTAGEGRGAKSPDHYWNAVLAVSLFFFFPMDFRSLLRAVWERQA